MGSRKAVSIGLVVLLHAALGYAFITGLAQNVIKATAEELNVIDIEEPPPPPEEPPPPPEQPDVVPPPPVVSPPPIVRTPTISPPQVTTVRIAPPPVITPTAPVAPPPPPPAAPVISKAASASGNPANWISDADYPPSAIRDEAEGTTSISWDINEQGRVESCRVTASSGNAALDDAACKSITRRGRYKPALNDAGQPMRSSASRRVKWQLPQD